MNGMYNPASLASYDTSYNYQQAFIKLKITEEEYDKKDGKAMAKLMKTTLTEFGNEQDWEVAVFELRLVLERIWSHKEELDITKYMSEQWHTNYDSELQRRADVY